MIEMQDACRLAINLEHVEIAIGVERIARVVARDHHGDATGSELMQGSDAAPARRAAAMPAAATFAMMAARSLSSASASEQQWPATMRPLNLWRSAASAIWPSERAFGESLSSTWKSRSRPFA